MGHTTDISDEELVKHYVASQKNIYFEELYERYSQKVYRKCYSFVLDKSKAEDLTHDIFIKVVTKIGTFKENARFSTWLYSITYNYCLDSLRKVKRAKEQALEDNMEFVEEQVDTEMLSMQSKGLQKSLSQISPEERSMLLMKYQDEFSIREISESMNLSESAVKMRLLRTKEKVKKLYLENVTVLLLIMVKFLMFLKK
ncbi:RNA polymerase sigma-70 factor, ECF subfamily [Spirosomataceae bacterium TFI 002]|nr:RNA polymerase sigma-70 factor, ECF subfamily [Spirosomataceae bacterium TFI 002]